MMVQIGNNGQWVNPKYVTSITRCEFNSMPDVKSEVWVVGNAGYGTYSIYSSLSPTDAAARINGQDCMESCALNEGVCPNGMVCEGYDEE
jgi:hypothetical protein